MAADHNWGNGFILATGLLAATSGPYELLGGEYGVTFQAAAIGTVSLSILGPDSSTYVPVVAFTAAGTATVFLPPCKVQVTVDSSTGVLFCVSPISNRR